MDDKKIRLQLFAEGGGAAGGDGGSAAATGEATQQAEQRLPARGKKRENPLANVTYGRQPQAQQQESAPTDAAGQKETEEASFEDLIKGRYKQDFEKRVQGIVQERLRGSRDREAKTAPIIEQIAKRYGMDHKADDFSLEALSDAIAGDTSQYEEEALEKGLPVEAVAKLHKLEHMEERQRQQAEARAQQTQIQRHLEGMVRQSEQLKELYPNFDLQAELRNPAFVKLTAPGVGVDVRTAYEVVHREEMRGAEMRFAAEKAAQRVSASVAANAKRPAENGVKGSGAAVTKTDPSKLTREDRAEIRRRVNSGEKIYF